MGQTLAALGDTARLRVRLEQSERRLIAAARTGGATWSEVARALGLGSRQAAEQRWQRLGGDPVGAAERPGVDRLRALLAVLHNRLVRLADDDPASAPVRLAGSTLELATDAPAGALHDLAAWAVDDLGRLAPAAVPAGVRELVERVAAEVGRRAEA